MIDHEFQTKNPLSGMNPNQVRGALIALGFTSIPKFAAAHGFKPQTVHNVIYRYAGKPDASPNGIKTAMILEAINNQIRKGEEQCSQ